MARLYADEDFSYPVVQRLRQLGHDIVTAQEAGQANQGIEDNTALDIVMTSLSRLEDKRQHTSTPAVDDLWNANHTPKGEDHLSNYVKRHLEDDRKRRGIIANREVVVRKGQRTDIHIQAIVEKNTDIVTVVVETRGGRK